MPKNDNVVYQFQGIRVYYDAEGLWRWCIVAINGQILAESARGRKNWRDIPQAVAAAMRAVEGSFPVNAFTKGLHKAMRPVIRV